MEENKDLKNRIKADVEAKRKKLSDAINAVLSTDSGKELFKFIYGYCAFEKSALVVNPITRQVDKDSTLYNVALRDLYLELRSLADRSLLMSVEFSDVTNKEDNNDKGY